MNPRDDHTNADATEKGSTMSDTTTAGTTTGAVSRSRPVVRTTPRRAGRTTTPRRSPVAKNQDSTGTPRRSRTLIAAISAAVVATLLAVTFAGLWYFDDSAEELAAVNDRAAVDATAQSKASTYALAVSQVDYQDLDAWRRALETDVSDQLKPKLNGAVDVVGPWLTQMQYVATAKLLAATVSKREGDTYVVQVFVDMNSKSRQAPNGVTATASYTITLDRASEWTITDVGGVGADLAAPEAGAEPAPPAPGSPAPPTPATPPQPAPK